MIHSSWQAETRKVSKTNTSVCFRLWNSLDSPLILSCLSNCWAVTGMMDCHSFPSPKVNGVFLFLLIVPRSDCHRQWTMSPNAWTSGGTRDFKDTAWQAFGSTRPVSLSLFLVRPRVSGCVTKGQWTINRSSQPESNSYERHKIIKIERKCRSFTRVGRGKISSLFSFTSRHL
jgi:hypothetical protein